MGNVNGRDEGEKGVEVEDSAGAASGSASLNWHPPPMVDNNHEDSGNNNHIHKAASPPGSPAPSAAPLLFAPQNQVIGGNESQEVDDQPSGHGIPTIITWNYGGNDVAVEGSWDNCTSRKKLQRSGKDHSILLVLPSGIYHYKFIVDGERRYIPDLPFVADEMGCVCNLLDVNDYVPENLDSVTEFEAPPTPDSSYSQAFPSEDDFAKEPLAVPPQLHLTVLDMENSNEASSSKPQHVVLNHLFIEKGWASQSLVALGLTHRFQSKYVTVVLYKPLKSWSLVDEEHGKLVKPMRI